MRSENLNRFYHLLLILGLLLVSACSPNGNSNVSGHSAPPEPPPIEQDDKNCVNIFYDTTNDATYKNLGRTYGLMLANLLGHFPEYRQIIGPIDLYREGDLDRCHASFYIGSTYNKPLPQEFIEDYKNTTHQVVWIGYNFWQLGEEFERSFGYGAGNSDFVFTPIDYRETSDDGKPGYFRDILYKGEVFYKFSTWSDSSHTNLITAAEMVKFLRQSDPGKSVALAQARHSTNHEILPWVIQAQNKFFVTEVPFSYIHEADRYMVFADLLFDFLQAAPRHDSRQAFLRLEDVHAQLELHYLDQAVNILKNQGVTPHISIIPIYKDPNFTPAQVIRMEDEPQFAAAIRRYQAEGSVFIWHGITHQYGNIHNPFSGISGDDYEFWDFNREKPIAEDSPAYILNKFENGFNSLRQFSLAPKLWLTPHYRASALDNIIFSRIFDWSIGRCVYNDYVIRTWKIPAVQKPATFSLTDATAIQNRRDLFASLDVEDVRGFRQFGQLFPYEIYGDIYGQNLLPENLGNVQPELNEQVVATRSVDAILADARRNLVLRDVWASVFYHPFLLDPELNPENAGNPAQTDLERLVRGLQNLGYNFVNLNTYAAQNVRPKTKPRLELTTIRQ